MKISITGRGVQVQDSFKEYAEQKAKRLDRYFDQLKNIEILLSSQGDEKVVEMIAQPRKGQRVIGQSKHEDAFAAVDLLVDKMYTQLNKLKEKKKDNRRHSERVPPPPVVAEPSDEEQLESYEEIVDKFSEQLE